MAEIFLAEAANIHGFRKKVVIKRMLPQYATEQVYIDMFLDEARLVARLNHPSVVQVFDIGEDDEGVFFTMEYVEGRDLSEILGTCYRADRQLGIEEVLAIAIPTAEALHHAHEARDDGGELINLIHRDVSPSNVIVTNAGRVKLLDFGVAKSKSQSRETTGVSLKGKFGYMAPEQCEGMTIDRRCDIYSFGVVLWELFTGKRLHGGGNEPQVLVKIMTEDPPPPSTKRADLPPELNAIVVKALSRNRENRFSTMQELLLAFDAFMTKSGTVVSSRTLSTMLQDVFAEERPTIAMAIPTPSAPPQLSPTPPPPPPQMAPQPPVHTPGAGSNGGHQAQPNAGSNGGHQGQGSGGSAGGHQGQGSGGSAGGHQGLPGSTPSGAHQIAPVPTPYGQADMSMTGPMPIPSVGANAPSLGYATLSPGSQFDQGSVIVPMKSRKGVLAAVLGTVFVLGLGLYLTSTTDGKAAAADDSEEEAEASDGTEDPITPTEPSEVVPEEPPVETMTAEEIAAAAQLEAKKKAADKAAADKKAAADALVTKNRSAAEAAAKKKAALAAKKAAADKRAADKKAAAEKRAAARKAAADKRPKEPKKPRDKKKKPKKWDPNSPFAPQ